MRHQSAVFSKRASGDVVKLRHVVQGTLAIARALCSVSDADYESYSNTTIESMPYDIILKLAELAHRNYQILMNEAQSRVAVAKR